MGGRLQTNASHPTFDTIVLSAHSRNCHGDCSSAFNLCFYSLGEFLYVVNLEVKEQVAGYTALAIAFFTHRQMALSLLDLCLSLVPSPMCADTEKVVIIERKCRWC